MCDQVLASSRLPATPSPSIAIGRSGSKQEVFEGLCRLVEYDDWFVREVEKGHAQIAAGHTAMPLEWRPMRDLGGYEIRGLLGAGGMGEVHRAYDKRLGREVAIKLLPQNFTTDAERLARFEREARLLASLNHPNIAAIYGIEDTSPILSTARVP
jgi:serine/threonine protein kinase